MAAKMIYSATILGIILLYNITLYNIHAQTQTLRTLRDYLHQLQLFMLEVGQISRTHECCISISQPKADRSWCFFGARLPVPFIHTISGDVRGLYEFVISSNHVK
jgi:hypothetical protein